MRFDELPQDKKSKIDLHGLTVDEAEMQLFEFIDAAPKPIQMIEVTHGFHHGTGIKLMVKNSFHHWRVSSKQVGLNPGVTYLLLK